MSLPLFYLILSLSLFWWSSFSLFFDGELSSVLSCLIISNTCLCFINFVFVFLVLYTGSRASLQFSFIKALLACPLKSIVAESGWTYPQGKSVLFRMEGSCHDMWGPPQVLQSVLVPREVKVLIVVLLRRWFRLSWSSL